MLNRDRTPLTNSSLRVLRIITRLNIGGPAIHTTLLTRDMEALGYSTTLVAGSCEEGDGDMSHPLRADDRVLWVEELSRSVNPGRNLKALYRLWRIMRRQRPHIVHTHTAMAGCLGRTAALLARVPVVVHTFHGNSLRHYFSPLVNAAFVRIERMLARRTDAICVLSGQQANELNGDFKIGDRSRYHIVPLGLDLTPFLRMPALDPGATLRIGWFGRLVPVKDVPLLAEVISRTVSEGHRVEFHIAGDGPERDQIAVLSAKFPLQVFWHGWLDDIAPVLEKCDVVIQTSKNEGTPVALIQGMAAGRPFLSTAVGGVNDMVAGDQQPGPGGRWFANGVLVEPNAESFTLAIAHLIAQPSRIRSLSEHARELASGRYRKETLCANLDTLYRQLISAKLKPSSQPTHVAYGQVPPGN